MILQELIDTYEELKKYVYIIKRGNNTSIILKFNDSNFFHLVGLHKTHLNMFIPEYISSKAKKYKYIKKNVKKFNNILLSEIKDNETLNNRIHSFYRIIDLLKDSKTSLYNLQPKLKGSLYDGDFGLLRIYEDINCLLGLVINDANGITISCSPQSWMASKKVNYLIEYRHPIYSEEIISIPSELFNPSESLVIT